MRRFILTTTTALSIMMSGTTGMCYAENSGFGDVTGAVLYYDDIQRLNDMGVLSGYDDGNFYPDNIISVAEGTSLTERVFGKSDISLDKYLFLGDTSRIIVKSLSAFVERRSRIL